MANTKENTKKEQTTQKQKFDNSNQVKWTKSLACPIKNVTIAENGARLFWIKRPNNIYNNYKFWIPESLIKAQDEDYCYFNIPNDFKLNIFRQKRSAKGLWEVADEKTVLGKDILKTIQNKLNDNEVELIKEELKLKKRPKQKEDEEVENTVKPEEQEKAQEQKQELKR